MTDSLPVVVPLSACSARGLAAYGGKGANLGELVAGGFPVPDGFVVTTAAYTAITDGTGLDALIDQGDDEGVRQWFDAVEVPDEITDAVLAAYAELGEPAVAVRSSATAEDLADASFAGQQDTYLNVVGAEALLAAIRRCWASLWTDRAIWLPGEHAGRPAGSSIAVVVQRLVRADAAGVMFTANPANGRREQTVITAAWGLGEAVVAGSVDTDDHRRGHRRGDDPEPRYVADKAIRVDAAGHRRRADADEPEPRTTCGTPPCSIDAQALRAGRHRVERSRATSARPRTSSGCSPTARSASSSPVRSRRCPSGWATVPTEWPVPREGPVLPRQHHRAAARPADTAVRRPDGHAVPSALDRLMTELAPGARVRRRRFSDHQRLRLLPLQLPRPRQHVKQTPHAFSMLTSRGGVTIEDRWHRRLAEYRRGVGRGRAT